MSHNHEESFKGAESISVAVFMAKNKFTKTEIEKFIIDNYYDLDFTLEEKRNLHGTGISCQDYVPQAFLSFFESKNFEDAIRNAISIGGDSDTVAAITGCLAGVYYGIPRKYIRKANKFFMEKYDYNLLEVMKNFEKKYPTKEIGF